MSVQSKERRQKMNRKKYGRILQIMIVFMLAFMTCPQISAQAAAAQTATLRIISTNDLHGQVSTMYYDFGSYKYGSLAQAYTLIRKARLEAGLDNTLTLDVGDSVFGYAADYIINYSDGDVVQPIYQAMAAVGYDGITLGNHDLDYGFAYLKKQLELSGLKDSCVLSNVILNDTGETPFQETKMITKKVRTNEGETREVKIGLVGVTVPTLSGYSDCEQDLTGLPIVSSVERTAGRLKEEGADLVVVMAHSSFGNAKPKDDAKNAVYALTMLDAVDAVAAGHAHKNFPSDDEKSQEFYRLENVDKETGLVNGKPVVMVADHGAGIGLMDLELEISPEGDVEVANAVASRRMVTKDTIADQGILDTQTEAIQPVDSSLDKVVGTISADEKIDSYFALMEDNYAIQLVNESKIQYGLAYTGGNGSARYADYPVVAMTNYKLCSSQSSRDQISLNGQITMQDILNMQQAGHNNNIIYWVNGDQLREVLEWSSSIYNTSDGKITSDEVLEQLLEKRGAKTIASEEWMEDWGAFAVFDGIEYTIDATQNPRYSKYGALKDPSARRIISLTYNGRPVTAEHKFMLVCDNIADNDATKGISDQKVLGRIGVAMAYKNLTEYIGQQQEFGSLVPSVDHNWSVVFDYGSEYIVRASIFSQPKAAVKTWFKELAATNEAFAYYLAQFAQAVEEDRDAPLLVAAPVQTEDTSDPVDIKVQANDYSGVDKILYLKGQVQAADASWDTAGVVSGGAFTADVNGVYSVAADDIYGNRTVKHVSIKNINPQSLPAPTIKKITNKSEVVKGKAASGTTVHISAGGQTYETETEEKGSYSCDVDYLEAGSEVTAYCTDDSGKYSKPVTTIVVKDGPDVPVIKEISNKSLQITGKYTTSAPFTLVMFAGSTAYCSSAQGKSLYENSPAYREDYTVEVVSYQQDGQNFRFDIPDYYDAETELEFVTIDKVGRISGTVEMTTVDKAPDIPHILEVCDAELTVRGWVTSVRKSGTVKVTVGGKTYTGKVTPEGTFAVRTEGLKKGQKITVVAKDVKSGLDRKSIAAESKVLSYKDYMSENLFTVQPVYSDSTKITGQAAAGYQAYIRIGQNEEQLLTDENGAFVYTLDNPLPKGEKLYFIARSEEGIEEVSLQKVLKAKVKKPKKTKKDKQKAEKTDKKKDKKTDKKTAGMTVPEEICVLNDEITTDTQQLKVLAKETGTVRMAIDGVEYTSEGGEYDESRNGYIHTFDLPESPQAQEISISLGDGGDGEGSSVTVERTAGISGTSGE